MEKLVLKPQHQADSGNGAIEVPIYFEEHHGELAGLAHDSMDSIITFNRDQWKLDTPQDMSIYIMTSMMTMLFHPSPMYRKVLLGLSLPLWYGRVKKIWQYSGGWSYPTGKRRVIGVKPPELWPDPLTNFGVKVFADSETDEEKFQWLLCHEAVHAFSYHLRLPLWLNEGIASYSVDLLYQKQTIRPELIQLLEKREEAAEDMNYRKIQSKEKKLLLYHFLRGYFLTRYLHENHGGLIGEIMAHRIPYKEINTKVASVLDIPVDQLWTQVDSILTAYFKD